jgi:hypothetical protein
MNYDDGKRREPMLLRFLLYSLIAYLVIGFIKKLVRGMNDRQNPANGQRSRPGKSASALMVRCAGCGTFIAESRAIIVGTSEFCSNACARRAAQRA